MAILKKTLFNRDLDKVNTLISDRDPLSKYFQITELEDTFTGGKNSFLIQGSPFLVNGTEIKIEIKDSQGETIYYEPADGDPEPYEGVSKAVAVHIYPDTPFGPCTITILGEVSDYVDTNGRIVSVPENWKSSYNVKWQKTINVNPNLRNTTKIRFYKRPKFEISEEVLPIYSRISNFVTISGSMSGRALSPLDNTDFRLFNGLVNYELRITDNNTFSQSMEGLQIEVNGLGQPYAPVLRDVVTSKLAIADVPYLETSSLNQTVQIVKGFQDASFTASFENIAYVSQSNVNSSFAKIKISNLDTFTGDVYRVKIFGKSQNLLSDFQLLEDIQLESSDILIVNEFSSSLNVRTGVFTQNILNSYWTSSAGITSPILSIDDTLLFKSVKLQPTIDSNTTSSLFNFRTSQSFAFTGGTEYELDFTPLLSSSISNYGRVDVYMTGSAFVDTDINFGFGKKLLTIDTPTSFRRFDKQQINFKADSTGTGSLLFLVKSGTWQLSDISLSTASETSFSPNEINITLNIPNKINDEKFDFKFEFYDINNNYVPIEFKESFTFVGGNDLIARKDIRLITTNNSFSYFNDNVDVFPSYIDFNVVPIAITGSITFYSSAFDSSGTLIPSTATPYPGQLIKLDDFNYRLTSASFSGSLINTNVSAMIYTASADGLQRYATIYRLNEGKLGKTGPGVVYRGEWVVGEQYYKTDTRRDVVLGSDTYYLCSVSHISQNGQRPSDDNGAFGDNWKTVWDTFSATFDSVATDILFAQDVYANRTINIGSNGGSPVIALDSDWPTHANPSIKISSSFYNDNGIFLGYDNGTPKFSIRGGDNGITWNGAALSISGSVDAREGNIGGWIIDRNSLRNYNSRIKLDPIPPAIEIYDDGTPSVKRLDIRFGEMTDYTANASTNYDINPPSISIPDTTYIGPTTINNPIVYSSTYDSLPVTQVGTYFGNIKWSGIDSGNPIGVTNETFSGYVIFDRGIEIRDSSDNVISVYYGNGGNVFTFNDTLLVPEFTTPNVSITFAKPDTYKIYTFYNIVGSIYSADPLDIRPPVFDLFGRTWDNAVFTFTTNIDLTEITTDGIQLLKNNQKYFRIKRDDFEGTNNRVIARVGGTMIFDAETNENDAIIIKNGNINLQNGSVITAAGSTINVANISVSSEIKWGTVNVGILKHKSSRPTLFLPNMLRTSDVSSPGVNPFVDVQWVQNGSDTGYVVRRTSSKRYKKNIENWNKTVLDKVVNLPIREYNYKAQDDTDSKLIGIIAEELDAIGLNEFVGIYEDKIDNIATSDLVFVLWKAIQELNTKVNRLESIITGSKI